MGGMTSDVSLLEIVSDDGKQFEMLHGDSIFQGATNVADKFFETLRLPSIFGDKVDKFKQKYPNKFQRQKQDVFSNLTLVRCGEPSWNLPLSDYFTPYLYKSARKRKTLTTTLKNRAKEGTLIPGFEEMKFKGKLEK